MPNISFLINNLEPNIIRKHISFSELPEIKTIFFINKQSSCSPNYIYIGEQEDVAGLLNSNPDLNDITIFVSGSFPDFDKILDRNLNLIVVSLDLFDLYNHLNSVLLKYHAWTDSFLRDSCEWRDIPHLINLASSVLQAPVFLLNSENKVIYSSTTYCSDSSFIGELQRRGRLDDGTTQLISKKIPLNAVGGHFNLRGEPDYNYFLNRITYKDKIIANLLVECNRKNCSIDVPYLTSKVADCIRNLVLKEKTDMFSINSEFYNILHEVIELDNTDDNYIRTRLNSLKHPLKTFFRIICVEFSKDENYDIPYSYITSQLGQLFPEDNITTYGNSIVIMLTYKERSFQPDIDYEKFDALLERYNAYAGISNGTRNLSKLRTMYLLAKSTARIGKILHRVKRQRIYNYEEFSMYHIIDLCTERFKDIYKHDDIIYLTHPAVIALTRHDCKHNNNLRDVLFYYLINGRNIKKTSEVMYMHRNTIKNKLNKIIEIVGHDLSDGRLQLRLLFSCMVMRYYEDYLKMEPQLKI